MISPIIKKGSGLLIAIIGLLGLVVVQISWGIIDPQRLLLIEGSPVYWPGLVGIELSLLSLFVALQGIGKWFFEREKYSLAEKFLFSSIAMLAGMALFVLLFGFSRRVNP